MLLTALSNFYVGFIKFAKKCWFIQISGKLLANYERKLHASLKSCSSVSRQKNMLGVGTLSVFMKINVKIRKKIGMN